MKIQIETADNGIILKVKQDSEDTDVNVFQYNDDSRDALKECLENIATMLGYDYDKYGKENINISFDKKGHKLD